MSTPTLAQPFASPTLRVIVVGSTDVDQRLRRDASMEVIRTHSPVDALGELARPLEESPAPTAIIIAHSAVTNDEASVFADAARSLTHDVKLLAIRRAGSAPSPKESIFDNALAADADAEAVRAAMNADAVCDAVTAPITTAAPGGRGETIDEGGSQPMGRDSGATQTPEAATHGDASPVEAPSMESPADTKLLSILLGGLDPTRAALEAISSRLGVTDLKFAKDPSEPSPDAKLVIADIRRGAKSFGALVSAQAPASRLEEEAHWLAHWLALHEQHRQLRQAAFTDPLTGSWNRRYFDQYLAMALSRARRSRNSVTLLLFDIDDFKRYNDQFGHGAGDEILVQTVELLRSVIRPTDRVCRIGGDEFVVVFDEPSGPRTLTSRHPDSITAIATRFQQQICEHRFPKLGMEAPSTLTISGGMATYPWDAGDAASLLERADELAMASKQAGKNLITIGPGAESARHLRGDEADSG